MSSQDLFVPQGPRFLTVRPLNKGIVGDLPANGIPKGALLDAKNFRAEKRGLRRRDPISNYANNAALDADDGEVVDVGTFWDTSGNQVVIVMGSKHIYELAGNALAGQYWKHTTGLINIASGASIVGSGTGWASTASPAPP